MTPGSHPYRNSFDVPSETRFRLREALEAVAKQITNTQEKIAYAAYCDKSETVVQLAVVIAGARSHEAELLRQLAELDKEKT